VTGDSPTQRCLEGGSTSATVAGIAADDCAEHSFSDGSRARPGCFEHPIRDLRSFTTSDLLPQVGGRLQGLSPPTSPVRSGCVLQHPERLFLPWVCFPSEVLLPDRCLTLAGGASTCGLPRVHPGTGFHDARRCLRMTPKSVRTMARCRLFGRGVASVAGRDLLGVFHVKERLSRLRRSWPRPVKNSALAAPFGD